MLFSASIRAQEFRRGTRPLSNSTATQRPKRLVSLLAFSLPIPRTMRQELGSNAYWTGAPLVDLIFAQLMPFVEDEARIQATGPSISLRAQAAQSLGIILHELATNASKYGALSVPAGKTIIRLAFPPKPLPLYPPSR